MKNYWLIKTEPDVFSVLDLKKQKKTLWTDVRNYQARNYLRSMKVADLCLFYHSSTTPAGVVGIAKITSEACPDPHQFDPKSDYYDPKATKENPRWFAPEVTFVEEFAEMLTTDRLRKEKALQNMVLLQRGSRLSVQPVTEKEFKHILSLRNDD